MSPPNLNNNQLSELDSLFELVSQRQTKDFGNISASNKADGSLLTSCDLWSDCLLYTSPSPRDRTRSRMPSSA